MVKNNKIVFSINSKIYPLEAIYSTSYNFLDRAYIFLDGDPSNNIKIQIKIKPSNSKLSLAKLKEEFFNELLNNTLRYQISRENKNLREFIVGTALLGSLGELKPSEKFFTDTKLVKTELKNAEENDEESVKEETFEDPLGIAIPWEEKFGQTKKKKNQKK